MDKVYTSDEEEIKELNKDDKEVVIYPPEGYKVKGMKVEKGDPWGLDKEKEKIVVIYEPTNKTRIRKYMKCIEDNLEDCFNFSEEDESLGWND